MTEIKDGKKILTTPVSSDDLRDIHIGDVIYLSGTMTACRDSAHKRLVEDGIDFPVDMKDNALFHAGPIVRKETDEAGNDRFTIVSVGPTTSMRMEKYEYDFVRITGTRVIIGKGGMKKNTERACKEFGAIHCVTPAGCAVLGAAAVEEIESADWLDLGMPEAVWKCRVKEFGPLIVTIDTYGRNYFEEKKIEYNRIKEEQTVKLEAAVRSLF